MAKLTMTTPQEEWLIIVSWCGALRSLMFCISWSFLQNDTSWSCERLMLPIYRWPTWWCPSAFCWKITWHWKVWSGLSEACHILGIPWGDIVSFVVINKNNTVNKNKIITNKNKCCDLLYYVLWPYSEPLLNPLNTELNPICQ